MIAEGINRAHRNFDAYLEEHVDINWEAQRRKIYEHFGLMPKNAEQRPEATRNDTNTRQRGSFDPLHDNSLRESGSFGRSTRRGQGTNTDRPRQGTPNRSMFGQSGMQKSVIGTPGVGSGNATLFADVAAKTSTSLGVQDSRFLREKQGKLAEKVQRLNEARLQEKVYPILQEFAILEGQPGGEVVSGSSSTREAQLMAYSPQANSPMHTKH